MNLTLGDVATLLSVGALLFGGALAFIMSRASNLFAARSAVASMDTRLREIETELARTVKHDEIGQVFDRLRLVETGVAVSNQSLSDLRGGMLRIEHQLSLIVQSQLAREGTAA